MRNLPDELVNVSCQPSILLYLPEGSESWAKGVAKASWMLQHHPEARGRMVVGGGGKPQTHKPEPRSAATALRDAVA